MDSLEGIKITIDRRTMSEKDDNKQAGQLCSCLWIIAFVYLPGILPIDTKGPPGLQNCQHSCTGLARYYKTGRRLSGVIYLCTLAQFAWRCWWACYYRKLKEYGLQSVHKLWNKLAHEFCIGMLTFKALLLMCSRRPRCLLPLHKLWGWVYSGYYSYISSPSNGL